MRSLNTNKRLVTRARSYILRTIVMICLCVCFLRSVVVAVVVVVVSIMKALIFITNNLI